MAPVTNGRVIFNSIPSGYPIPGETTIYDTSQTIDPDTVPLNGGILIKTVVLSPDPYMRSRMRAPEIKSFFPAFVIGEPLTGHGVGVVLRSENQNVKKGDHIGGIFQHQQYSIIPSMDGFQVLQNEHKLPWSLFVGILGMPGQTAYMAWKEYAHAKEGEVLFVSGGAGPVGSNVIQIAKREGLKVISSAGTEEKVQYMKSIKADVPFNYKTSSTAEVLAKEGPVDIYWDNVGGPTLDAALDAANLNARFLMCGAISGYNNEPMPIKNLHQTFVKSLTLSGFIHSRLVDKYRDEFFNVFPALVARGDIKYKEDVTKGLQHMGDVLLRVLKGQNEGKAVVLVTWQDE